MFDFSTSFHRIRALLPTRCLLCRGRCDGPQPLCEGCRRELPWLRRQCRRCALPMHDSAALSHPGECGECLRQPPPWQRCIAAFEYRPPISQLIGRYKQHSDLACGRTLAELLGELLARRLCEKRLDQSPLAPPDLLLPAPLHWRRQLLRGFNQSYDLARLLGARLAIPCSHNHIRKHRHTSPQHSLSRDQRQRNLRAVFEVRRPVAGKRIALIDDVVTTGSTAKALTGILLKAGAAGVEIWCLARTPRPDR